MKKIIFIFSFIYSQIFWGQERRQNLQVHWPEEYQWKIISNQENDEQHVIELIPGKESPDKWTMLGMMNSLKNTIVPNVDVLIKVYEKVCLEESPLARLTVLEKNKEGEDIWILFKVESPSFPNDTKPESQLWYVIQGENTLHSMFIAIKEKSLSQEFVKKWSSVFKNRMFFYEDLD